MAKPRRHCSSPGPRSPLGGSTALQNLSLAPQIMKLCPASKRNRGPVMREGEGTAELLTYSNQDPWSLSLRKFCACGKQFLAFCLFLPIRNPSAPAQCSWLSAPTHTQDEPLEGERHLVTEARRAEPSLPLHTPCSDQSFLPAARAAALGTAPCPGWCSSSAISDCAGHCSVGQGGH